MARTRILTAAPDPTAPRPAASPPPPPGPPLRPDGRPEGAPVRRTKHHGVTKGSIKTIRGTEGPPRLIIDETVLYDLALTHASYDQMGRILGCSGELLFLRPEYKAIIEKARAEKRQSLLAAQFAAAITDRNPTMLIWMGKQYLGQKDVQRTETTGADGKPVQHEHAYKAVAYFPENGRNPQKQLPSATVTLDNGTTEEAEAFLEVDPTAGLPDPVVPADPADPPDLPASAPPDGRRRGPFPTARAARRRRAG